MSALGLPKVLSSSDTVVEASGDHKPIQAVALDPSGARMVTGGMDGVLKYWDFGGMNCVAPRPFREFVPVEANPINALSFSEVGTMVLCITADAKARIFDREGSVRPIEETIKGDQYIRTPENTKGHTHMLSCGEFHPKDNHRFLTGSYDSTVRLWDLTAKKVGMDQNIPNMNCFKCVDARGICGGNKMHVSAAAYSGDGSQIIAGCSDGSLHLFHEKNKYGKGLQIVRSAHMGEITGAKFLFADSQLVTRGTDDCVKYWDVRKLKDPLHSWSGIETVRSGSNLSISPDSKFVVAGTATGELAVIDLTTGEVCGRKKLATRQLVHTVWHSDLNQVVSTAVDGNVFICYDEIESRKGALLFVNKQPGIAAREPLIKPPVDAGNVFAYEELIESGNYRENRQGELKEVVQRQQIQRGIETIRSGGVMQALLSRKHAGGVVPDAQKTLLAFGDDPRGVVSGAYAKNQPEPVLDFSDNNMQVDVMLKRKQYCPQCGLKICTCGFMSGSAPSRLASGISGPSVSSKKHRP